MLSSNVRPFPRAGMKLLEPRIINLPIVGRWMNPSVAMLASTASTSASLM
jgi:hypothetical protein